MDNPSRAQQTYAKLEKLETDKVPREQTRIEALVQHVRQDFEKEGEPISPELDARIRGAAMRSNLASAEVKLASFVTDTANQDIGTIRYLSRALRQQFIAGGIKVTLFKRLKPKKLEQDVRSATARAIALAKRRSVPLAASTLGGGR